MSVSKKRAKSELAAGFISVCALLISVALAAVSWLAPCHPPDTVMPDPYGGVAVSLIAAGAVFWTLAAVLAIFIAFANAGGEPPGFPTGSRGCLGGLAIFAAVPVTLLISGIMLWAVMDTAFPC